MTHSVKTQLAKRAVGRPTIYHAEMPNRVDEFLLLCDSANDLPTVEGLAVYLYIDTDTLVEWSKLYPEFSVAIKRLKLIQANILQKGIFADSKQHGAGGIFLLKNNHGFKDQQSVDFTSGGKPLLGGITNHDSDDSDKKNLPTP